MVKEKPILFSGPMIRAILEGQKTQTRRIIDKCTADAIRFFGCEDCGEFDAVIEFSSEGHSGEGWYIGCGEYPEEGSYFTKCPYGQPGDHLWVRETGMKPPFITTKMLRDGADTWPKYIYLEDETCFDIEQWKEWGWKVTPSIHMPRWASRVTLEITNIRVERVQDISIKDSVAEGVPCQELGITDDELCRAQFADIWDSLNKKRDGCGWDKNPWVWVIEFKRI